MSLAAISWHACSSNCLPAQFLAALSSVCSSSYHYVKLPGRLRGLNLELPASRKAAALFIFVAVFFSHRLGRCTKDPNLVMPCWLRKQENLEGGSCGSFHEWPKSRGSPEGPGRRPNTKAVWAWGGPAPVQRIGIRAFGCLEEPLLRCLRQVLGLFHECRKALNIT